MEAYLLAVLEMLRHQPPWVGRREVSSPLRASTFLLETDLAQEHFRTGTVMCWMLWASGFLFAWER